MNVYKLVVHWIYSFATPFVVDVVVVVPHTHAAENLPTQWEIDLITHNENTVRVPCINLRSPSSVFPFQVVSYSATANVVAISSVLLLQPLWFLSFFWLSARRRRFIRSLGASLIWGQARARTHIQTHKKHTHFLCRRRRDLPFRTRGVLEIELM